MDQPHHPNNISNFSLIFTYNMLKITRIYDRTNSETAIQWRSLGYNRVLKSHNIACCFVSIMGPFIVRFSITLLTFGKFVEFLKSSTVKAG